LGVEFREPNANLANARIQSLGSGAVPMGFEVEVHVAYDSPPNRVRAALEKAAATSPLVVDSPPPVALVNEFGAWGVGYRLRIWSRQVHSVTRLLADVRSRIWYELRREGFVIPYPIQIIEHSSTREAAAERGERLTARAERLLEHVDFLAALPAEVRRRLAVAARDLHFDTGEKLVVEGDRGDSLFVVAAGQVTVSKSGEEIGASSVSLATLGPGDYFGEMSLLTGAPRTATVTAQGAVEVMVLDRAALAPALQSDPPLAETLSRVLAQRVAATAALFEGRRDELRRKAAPEQQGLLEKIRDFFRLD